MSTDTEEKTEKASSKSNSSNDEKELASVCEQLDVLALEYLDKMEEYSNNSNRTSDHFQQGFLHLAHAKYAMGTNKVSSLYYDERMKAKTRVCIDDETGSITLLNEPFEESKDTEEQKGESALEPKATMPRRRKKVAHKDSDDKENALPSLSEPATTKKKTAIQNPLHWFGLFVSPSLRVSQTHFVKATHELLDHVNCLNDLARLEKQYLALAEQKKLLLKQVQDHID